MKQYATPGALFTLVKDAGVVLSKGYGLADRENGVSVDPERTLVRAYSVSKSFTATAVMQLAEAGKLELDEDVNAYLDVPP